MENPILLFDGVCNLCNSTIQFVIKRDVRKYFKFASLQSGFGQDFLRKHNLSTNKFDTFILIQGDSYFTRSTAILKVFKNLKGLWPILFYFIFIPKFTRDPLYNFIANNRYKVFGKRDFCIIPDKEILSRFIE